MRPRVPIVCGIAGIGLYAALLGGLLDALPAILRVPLAGAALVLTPGFAAIALGAVPPGGMRLAAGWAVAFGVAWNGFWVLVTRAAGLPFTVLERALLGLDALLWLVVLVVLARRGAAAADAPDEEDLAAGADDAARAARWARDPAPRWGAGATLVLLLALGLGVLNTARLGTPLGYITDSPDHVATVRRMLQTGDAFTPDAYFRDAGEQGADPRKGLWHPQAALATALAGADPLEGWQWLSLLLVPTFVLNAAAFGFLLGGPAGAAAAGLALVLTYGGSFAESYLREAVFATKLGDQLAMAGVTAVLADLARRTRGSRLAAIGIGLGAVAAHVWYAIQFAMVLSALGVGLLARERRWTPALGRLSGTALALGAAALPYLAWRALQAYAPVNVIHTAPQGLLTLWDGVTVMNLGVLWDWLGLWWVVVPLSAVALWRAGRGQPAVLFLLTTPAIVATVLFVPPVVALLQPKLGYLLLRTVWMVPLAPLLGWWVARGLRGLRAGGRARLVAALQLAGLLLVSLPGLGDAVIAVRDPDRFGRWEREHSFRLWEDALRWMQERLPAGQVVLADPLTSYTVPMITGHYVVTLLDQHSSPSDPHALDRILDARDALDPHVPWDRVRAVVDRYGVTTIFLNARLVEVPVLWYWTPRKEWFAASRARFDRRPEAFEPLFDTGDAVVYRVRRAALDTLSSPPDPRPYARPYEPGRDPVARRIADGVPALLGFRITPPLAERGDTLRGIAQWRPAAALPRGSYVVSVRFDRELPAGFDPPRVVGKPARKLLELARGERYRFRGDHLPVGGDYGVDLWRTDEVVSDSFEVRVPHDAAPGDYLVKVRFIAQAPYPNYRLSDYFFDDDYYAGVTVASVRVRVPGRDPGEGIRTGLPGGH